MPESLRILLTKLVSGKEHATVNNENVKRLVNSFGSDIVNGVMKGRMLTKKHYFLSLGLHSMIGTRSVITILNKLGHCLNYNKTCEIETAIADSTSIRAKEKNILPSLPVGDETILTFFWTDNYDVNIESQKGGGSINTTHLMAFRESVEGIPNNTNNNISLTRSKRRKISIDPAAESALPSINKNAEPTKFNQIIKPNSAPSRFFFIVRSTVAFPKVGFSRSDCSNFKWLAYKYPKETFNKSYKNNKSVFTTNFI